MIIVESQKRSLGPINSSPPYYYVEVVDKSKYELNVTMCVICNCPFPLFDINVCNC
jgi:hypothetical protein